MASKGFDLDVLHDNRTRFAFLAETSRYLADSLDFQSTLETAAGLALPHFGVASGAEPRRLLNAALRLTPSPPTT